MKTESTGPSYGKLNSIAFPAASYRLGAGFTRIDLCAIVAGLMALIGVAIPALANKARSEQVACFNNLRQIGRAFHLWGNDHDGQLPFYVPVSEGGTQPATGVVAGTTAWFEFGVLSNELGSPKILACPADTKHPASEFSLDPAKGVFHANFRNDAVSYFLAHPAPQFSQQLLSGDRNIANRGSVPCSVFQNSATLVSPFNDTPKVQWTEGLHVTMGSLLRWNGQVESADHAGLRQILAATHGSDNTLHLLMP